MRFRSLLVLVLLLLVIGITAAQDLVPLPVNRPYAAHYLVVEADTAGNLNVAHYQRVQMSTPLVSISDAELAARASSASRHIDKATVRLLNANGTVIYQNVIEMSQWLRGEFLIDENNPNVMVNGTNIDGHLFPQTTRTFVVRVPDLGAATTLQVQPGSTAVRSDLNLDSLAQQFVGQEVAPRGESIPGWDNGSPANRADFLVMGDGYTAAEESTFETNSVTLANGFAAITPYAEYANYVNMRRLFTASNESGADRPSCPSDPPGGGLDNNTFVDTAFDATFCTNNIWRLLTVNSSKVLAAAAGEPDWDQIVVVVNTSIYGGSGGFISVLSTHTSAIGVLQHELGHSFTDLADEYETAYPGFPACSDINGPTGDDCEANVTNQTVRELIKWNEWIDPSTDIPTVNPLPDQEAAGLWEGARYLSTGMYRQGHNCMMRALARPFCYVASEAYVLRLYNGGWGVPSGGITQIEPGTLFPPTNTVNIPGGGTQPFSGQVLVPVDGPDSTVQWLVDGVVVDEYTVSNGITAGYNYSPPFAGTYTLEMRVTDNSALIHPDNRAGTVSTGSWTVNVLGDAPTETPESPTATPTPTDIPGSELVQNGDFENLGTDGKPDVTPWTIKNASGDKAKCNKDKDGDGIPDKIVANAGECAFQFKNVVGETGKIQQNLDLSGVIPAIGDTLNLSTFAQGKSGATVKIKVVVKYSDDTKTKISVESDGSEVYTEFTGSETLTNDDITKAKINLKSSQTTGKVYVDDVSLILTPGGGARLISLPAPR